MYIYEELIDKHGGSAMLLCGLAVAKMHLGQFEEAEARLQEALIKVRRRKFSFCKPCYFFTIFYLF